MKLAESSAMENVLEAAIRDLRSAFPSRSIDPGSFPDEWHVGTIHTTDFMEAVRGKTWEQLPESLLERDHDALSELGPHALVSVLPSFLVALLRRAPELDMLPTFLLGTLTRKPETASRFDAWSTLLSTDQREAIRRGLEAWERSSPTHAEWTRSALDSYWNVRR
jgi:hypothetical protein